MKPYLFLKDIDFNDKEILINYCYRNKITVVSYRNKNPEYMLNNYLVLTAEKEEDLTLVAIMFGDKFTVEKETRYNPNVYDYYCNSWNDELVYLSSCRKPEKYDIKVIICIKSDYHNKGYSLFKNHPLLLDFLYTKTTGKINITDGFWKNAKNGAKISFTNIEDYLLFKDEINKSDNIKITKTYKAK
jgi:hypothetical protein